jgi:hypothetical protein
MYYRISAKVFKLLVQAILVHSSIALRVYTEHWNFRAKRKLMNRRNEIVLNLIRLQLLLIVSVKKKRRQNVLYKLLFASKLLSKNDSR